MKTPWLFLLAFALLFYSNGAAFIEGFVNYPSWRLIGRGEFVAYHHFITPRILSLMVAPALLVTVLTGSMLKWRPGAIPLWSVWVALALQVVGWISTATLQVPMQVQFGTQGFSEDTLANLIVTNFWLRRIPMGLTAILFVWMIHRVISRAPRTETAKTHD